MKRAGRLAAGCLCWLMVAGGPLHAQPTSAPASSTAPVTVARLHGQFLLQDQWEQVRVLDGAGAWGGLFVLDRATKRSVYVPEAFALTLRDGRVLRSSSMQLTRPLTVQTLSPDQHAPRYAEHFAGTAVCAEFTDAASAARVQWCGVLRDGANYFRQKVTVRTGPLPLPVTQVTLLRLKDAHAHVAGTVKGSPIVDDTWFFGMEHPLSVSTVKAGEALATLPRELPIPAGASVTFSSVIGVAPAGQMRRAFLRYLERERAHPYRPFLQYNTWYDLGEGDRYDEAGVLDRIHAFGEELVRKRGVQISSFLLDDGWDNTSSLWEVGPGFPRGLQRVAQTASQYGAGLGLWLSPWGGYEEQKKERTAYGRAHGMEIIDGGFALSGPKYYEKFESVCLDAVRRYGVNEFKLDGTGNADRVFPGSRFDSDFDAAVHLIRVLRRQRPGIFINLTTGTYASPFWLLDADAIWRGGEDHSFTGAGDQRQRWTTYRDAQTYKNIVRLGPLFPLNSVMLHGIIDARLAEGLDTASEKDFRDEVWSFFGSGTQVQEMYLTPALLSRTEWDTLAQAARWARKNAGTLKDTHWTGGDPGRAEVYGWASWSPEKAILVLRNPSGRPQKFPLDVRSVMELPASAAQTYLARDLLRPGPRQRALPLHAGQTTVLTLGPFEVRVLEATPALRTSRDRAKQQ